MGLEKMLVPVVSNLVKNSDLILGCTKTIVGGAAVCYVAKEFFDTERCAIEHGHETSLGIQKDGTAIGLAYQTKKSKS